MKGSNVFFVPLMFIPLEDTKLRNERRVGMEQMTPEQWDVFATCWRMNIDTWASHQQPIFTFASLFSYFTYFRWKHGKKVFAPIMKIAGFPPLASLPPKFPLRTEGAIDPRYCREDPQAVAAAQELRELPVLQEVSVPPPQVVR